MFPNKGYVLLTARLQNEDDVWTARCLELGTSTFGDTLEEAEEAISEAIEWHLDVLGKHGERNTGYWEPYGVTRQARIERSALKTTIPNYATR